MPHESADVAERKAPAEAGAVTASTIHFTPDEFKAALDRAGYRSFSIAR
jgi:hypothetical protein